jgi:hypothetical protein
VTPQEFVKRFDKWVKVTQFRCTGYHIDIRVSNGSFDMGRCGKFTAAKKPEVRAEGTVSLNSAQSQYEHCTFCLKGDAAELFSDAMLERFKQAVRDYAERWGQVLKESKP